jgi:hypothetical protein
LLSVKPKQILFISYFAYIILLKISNLKKVLPFFVLTYFFLSSSCNWFAPKPEIATLLAKYFNNKLYKHFDTAVYKSVFINELNKEPKSYLTTKVIKAFYQKNENLPVLITKFYTHGGLDSLRNYVARSKNDGFNPEIFQLKELEENIKILNQNKFKNLGELYPIIAKLELKTAHSLLIYTNFMRYGSINPRNILNRYYIKVKRPDSLKMDSVLQTNNIAKTLVDAQQTSKNYVELKKLLAFYRDSLKTENDWAIKTIKLNLERMRWQLPYKTDEYVLVNIPDFTLTWFKKEDTLIKMKVCVGGKREAAYAEKMKRFLKFGRLDDKPRNHETPQLISKFNAIQVNPVWNIPTSIAQSEIYWMARKYPNYLRNSNIKVYNLKGKTVSPDSINWNKYSRANLPFQFKQGSGGGNALGKFKFVFDNGSSIYLHDTNNKNGFNLKNRAISHGCVRVENPLKFAQLMVRSKRQYDELRMDVNLPPLDSNRRAYFSKTGAKKLGPTWFKVRKNISVVIGYYTAWAENGKVEFRPDVYNYDGVLWNALEKYM